jgi:hypothetical protein
MSLGLLMTAYLKWHGMDEATLSLARGLGAASGIAATFAFPWLQSRTGRENTERHVDALSCNCCPIDHVGAMHRRSCRDSERGIFTSAEAPLSPALPQSHVHCGIPR